MFKIPFDIPPSEKKINIHDSILLLGSCFSDEIGQRLSESKFKVVSNPFGTIYNPHSILDVLTDKIEDEDVVESQGVFFHWDAHSILSGISEADLIKKVEQAKIETQAFLKEAKWLIITLGTAIIYELSNGKVVANCHKVPSKSFKKRFLKQEEITDQFEGLINHLRVINPDMQILLTVSPVRHIRDGLIENNRSKSILIDVVHSLVETHHNVGYFPSYEILIDELRDYRFYADDMVHPSKQSIDYVWESFMATYFDEDTQDLQKEWQKLKSALNHRPFHPETEKHQKFLASTLQKLETLNEKLDVSVEIEQIRSQII